jgi:NodT family efflux transporter outer membrane factor (OMF) lipoprotein
MKWSRHINQIKFKKMNYHNIVRDALMAFMILTVIAGCAAPRRTADIVVAPLIFRNDTAVAHTESVASLPWKEFLANRELIALIDTALVKNNDLQIAVKDIEAADALYRKAKLELLPTVGLSATSNNSLPSKNSLNGLTANQFLGSDNLDDYKVSLGISWEADIWGKVKNRRAEAMAGYLKTQEARKGIQTTIVASIANGYHNLLMLDLQLVIAKKNLELNDSTLEILRLQYAAAQVSSLAVQQVEAQKLLAAQLIPRLERQINVQENALSVLAGVMPQAIKRSGSLDELNMPARLNAGVPSEMLSRRPDVKSSELDLQAANARIGIARANMYPSLTISASGGLNSLRTSDWFNLPASLFGIVAGAVTQPVFQKGELKTQYNVAKIQREQSVLRFRQSILTAYQEVSDALVRIDKLEKEQAIAAARVGELQHTTTNAGLLFKSGFANYLEVLTAQSNTLLGELELASLKREQLNAVIDLYRSLGGGWN